MRKVSAADISRMAKIGKDIPFPSLQEPRVSLDQDMECRFSASGDGQQMQRPFVVRGLRRINRGFLQYNVRVGPAESERTDAGNAFSVKRWPRCSLASDPHR